MRYWNGESAQATKWMLGVGGPGVPRGGQLASASQTQVKLAEGTLGAISVPGQGPWRRPSRPLRVIAER